MTSARPLHVILNLFQNPSCLRALSVRDEEWMLKRGQHDGLDKGGA
jgi:hypothetical protein